MLKRVIAYVLPVLMILSFVYVMTSGEIQKQPRGEGDNVSVLIEQLEENIMQEEWTHAEQTLEQLEIAVGKVLPRVQYSAGRDDIINLERNLSRVRGNVRGKEKAGALSELAEANYFWHLLAK